MADHLTDWVAYNARRHRSTTAVENLDTGEALTWAEFEDLVSRLSRVLVERLGIGEGDRVGLVADDDWRVLALQFACVRIGAIFVPFNWRLVVVELERLCKDAELSLLVHDDTWQETAAQLGALLEVPLASWACRDAGRDLDALTGAAERFPDTGWRTGDRVTQMLYTSGTTGLPKGALVTLGGMVWHALNVQHEMCISGPPARYLSALPLFHAAGLNAITNPILMAGGTVSILRRFDPERAAALLGDPSEGFTNFNGAPVMYRMISEFSGPHSDYSSLRAAMVGGGAIPSDVGEHFSARGIELQVGWGATEMGPSVTLMPKGDRVRKAHTVGFLVQHAQLRVVDPATDEDVDPGEVGEAWVRGPAITPGYWRREREDDAAMREGWFKSGDAVRVDEEGFVALRGRYKDMYKSGGENVFAAEVERVITAHPAVADAAVVGLPDERWGEVGCAVVVLKPGAAIAEGEIEAHCADRLAKYKVPAAVIVRDDLPRNVTGKVQKNVLQAQLAGQSA